MIVLRQVTLRRSAKVLLDKVSLTINPGEKVGLVGRNGAGKSTLFALLNGSLHEDAGDFSVPAQWRLGQVAQNMPETEEPATAFVLAGDTRLMELRAQLAAAEAAGDADPDDHDAGMAIAHAHSDLADAGDHDAVPRAQSLILGLGFRTDQLELPVNSFSGGWRMRLQLARALMCPSDLLLLDEPTNHLDLATREALSVALNEFEGTVMLVSHDRALLRAVCDEFWLVSRGGIEPFDGDLDDYQRYLLDMAKQSREAQRQEQRDQQRAPASVPAAAPPVKAAKAVEVNRTPEQKRSDAQRRQQQAEKARPLKKELEQTEKRMAQLAQDKTRLEAAMSQPANPAELAEAGRRLKAVNDETDTLEARWLELHEAIEAVGN
jgi:ATP-binding cassette subfamily F protein 3